MIAALILLLSIGALFQFFLSYCRSLVAIYSQEELSSLAQEYTNLGNRTVHGSDLKRLVRLVRQFPYPLGDTMQLLAVRVYYHLLAIVGILGRLRPAVVGWLEREQAGCAYCVAVALDRRISRRVETMS